MTELKIMGIVFGAAILWFIYTIFIKDKLLQRKSIAGKVESILKKDMSSKYARCIFYMDNDYDNGYSQSEWLNLFKKSIADKEWDKNSQEYTEAVANLESLGKELSAQLEISSPSLSVNISSGSPSRMRMVRRISLGITTLPRSSMRRTMPVAFIYHQSP